MLACLPDLHVTKNKHQKWINNIGPRLNANYLSLSQSNILVPTFACIHRGGAAPGVNLSLDDMVPEQVNFAPVLSGAKVHGNHMYLSLSLSLSVCVCARALLETLLITIME